MNSYKGKNIEFSITGKSHSNSLELTICGLPKNTIVSLDKIKQNLLLRNPKLFFNTQRNEEDEFNVEGISSTGETISDKIIVSFKNKSFNDKPYKANDGFLRPSHSDYAQLLYSKEIYPGGGEFSGRLTLPLAFIGSIAKQILELKGIFIVSRIKSVYNLSDKELDDESISLLKNLSLEDKKFPVVSKKFKTNCFKLLENIKKENDSVGGVIETVVLNTKPGLGGPLFNGLESKISNLLFGIPAIKGVEFGDGFSFLNKKGSEAEDEFYLDNGTIKTKNNHNGGINGGVSNGMPIIIRTIVKPAPTIKKPLTSLRWCR